MTYYKINMSMNDYEDLTMLVEQVLTEQDMINSLSEKEQGILAKILLKLLDLFQHGQYDEAMKGLQSAVSDKEKIDSGEVQLEYFVIGDEELLEEGLKDFAKRIGKGVKDVAGGLVKNALSAVCFYWIGKQFGFPATLVSVLGTVALGILRDIKNRVPFRKSIRNMAMRFLTGAAAATVIGAIDNTAYIPDAVHSYEKYATVQDTAKETNGGWADKAAAVIDHIGHRTKQMFGAEDPRAAGSKFGAARDDLKYIQPTGFGASVRELTPWARNNYQKVDGGRAIVSPTMPEHTLSDREVALTGAVRSLPQTVTNSKVGKSALKKLTKAAGEVNAERKIKK